MLFNSNKILYIKLVKLSNYNSITIKVIDISNIDDIDLNF